MKEGCWTPKILQAEDRVIKLLSFKDVLSFKKKKRKEKTRNSKSRIFGPYAYSGSSSYKGLFQASKPNGICPAGFENGSVTMTSFSFPFSLLE